MAEHNSTFTETGDQLLIVTAWFVGQVLLFRHRIWLTGGSHCSLALRTSTGVPWGDSPPSSAIPCSADPRDTPGTHQSPAGPHSHPQGQILPHLLFTK